MSRNFSVCVTLLILVSIIGICCFAAETTSPVAKAGCQSRCGNFTISYPYGIGSPDCFYNEWFEILCQNGRPYLGNYYGPDHVGAEILRIGRDLIINTNSSKMHVCEDTSEWLAGNISGGPFTYAFNNFMMFGCGNAMFFGGKDFRTGCSSDTDLLRGYGYTEFHLNFSNSLVGKNSCATVLLVHDFWHPENASLFTDPSADLSGVSVQVSLWWDIRTSTPGQGFGNNRNCKVGYGGILECSCPCGYSGNPYLPEGCQDRIENLSKFCPSSFLKKNLASIVVGGTSLLISILVSTSYLVYKAVRRRIERKAKEKKFKRNGGLLLQKFLSSMESSVEKVRLFTGKDLNKATDHFNENRVLGRGGQATVYKGMLDDRKIVAIKKSKLIDASQVKEFINEIIILSQIDHRNVVKLLGCCLEMDVPMLVYEFIPNGTLYNLIHSENTDFHLSWEVPLRISLEVAEALAYLHSATSFPIYHRDIKSSNILLDDKYRAKVTDFGTSKHIGIDQTHLTTLVKGTFGYLDPEYFRSSKFTEKSDVYSFGVVVVELLTGLKPICFSEEEETSLNLATRFLLAIEENSVDMLLDPQVRDTSNKEEVGVLIRLAQKCLNVNGKNRPSMKETVMELGSIKMSQMPTTVLLNSYGDGDIKRKEMKFATEQVNPHGHSDIKINEVKFASISPFHLEPSSSNNSPLLLNTF